jgi:hypothetical protein
LPSYGAFCSLQGDDLDQAYDSISAFSSRRNNQEAVFGAEESIKEVRLDLHITYANLYFLFHAYYKALETSITVQFFSVDYHVCTKFIDRWCTVKCFFFLVRSLLTDDALINVFFPREKLVNFVEKFGFMSITLLGHAFT